jgi:hypothetical protein
MPAQGDVRRDVGEVADDVVVVDTGRGVHEHVATNSAVRLNDRAVQNHRTLANCGAFGHDRSGVPSDAVGGLQ